MAAFKYIGCILMVTDDKWMVVATNPRKSRKKLVWVYRTLGQQGGECTDV